MTILVTGGSGHTASRLAALLRANSHHVLVASRKGAAGDFPAAKFDFTDDATFGNPFAHPTSQASPITAVYLLSPPGHPDPTNMLTAFIDFAREKGVKRFVLLSASPVEAGGPLTGKTHAYLRDLGVEWAVLRPTWFHENFIGQQSRYRISGDTIYSSTGDATIPFVSADDIAAVAYRALTDERPHNTEHLVLGPELLSYSDVASIWSSVLGRKVAHKDLTEAELSDQFVKSGIPEAYAVPLAKMDTDIRHGSESRLGGDVEKVTGRLPIKFEDFALKNKDDEVWSPKKAEQV